MSKKVAETIEMSVTDARQGFLALVDRLTDEESIVCVTKHGRPTVAMLSWKAYERVQEILATVEVLSDPELVEQIQRGEREIEAGEGIHLEQLIAELDQEG